MTPEELDRLITAFKRESAYIQHLSDELYLAKVRTYIDTLSSLADAYGYESEDVQLGTQIQQALSDEADARAESIAATYNKRMEMFTRRQGTLGLSYEQTVEALASWSTEYDEARAELISVSEAYPAHADAIASFFQDNGIEVSFDFGGHGLDAPPQCPICRALEARNPHPPERMVAVGTPHPQCRQNWHPNLDEAALPEEIELGLRGTAGIVGTQSLITRSGSQQDAVKTIEEIS